MPAYTDLLGLLDLSPSRQVKWPFAVDGDGTGIEVSLQITPQTEGTYGGAATLFKDGEAVTTGTISGTAPAGGIVAIGETAHRLAAPLSFEGADEPVGNLLLFSTGSEVQWNDSNGDGDAGFARISSMRGLPFTVLSSLGESSGRVRAPVLLRQARYMVNAVSMSGTMRGYPARLFDQGDEVAFEFKLPATDLRDYFDCGITMNIPAGQGVIQFTDTLGSQVGGLVSYFADGNETPVWAGLIDWSVAQQIVIDQSSRESEQTQTTAIWQVDRLPFIPTSVVGSEGNIWRVSGVERVDGGGDSFRLVCERGGVPS